MELVSLAKEMVQTVAEWAASYKLGQSALRQLDRTLWVVEKCARWAVPPPLDQDERPQPELVRPLPWVFFLVLLITLRVTRESISLINLVMGKPPLRSADVVMYIQSKRRYLRTLKYQGNRVMRARSSAPTPAQRTWYSRVQALFEFTMCFRNSQNYGNNNTTHVSNNDEVLVVKRSKRREEPSAETTMERLIERMMHDLADSDDDSSYTLTNVTSIRSDRSDTPESDQDTILHHEASTPRNSKILDHDISAAFNQTESTQEMNRSFIESSETEKQENSSVAHVQSVQEKQMNEVSEKQMNQISETQWNEVSEKLNEISEKQNNVTETQLSNDAEKQENNENEQELSEKQEPNPIPERTEDAALQSQPLSPSRSIKEETQMMIQREKSPATSPNKDRKNANGQIVRSSSKKKGLNSDLRETNPNNISM